MFYFYKNKINVSSLKPFPCFYTLFYQTQPINHNHIPSYGYIYSKYHHKFAKGTWMTVHNLTFYPHAQWQYHYNYYAISQHMPHQYLICKLLTWFFPYSTKPHICNCKACFAYRIWHLPVASVTELSYPTLSCWYYHLDIN